MAEWNFDVSKAPRDGSPVLFKFRDDIFPTLKPNRDDLRRWNGCYAVLRMPPDWEFGWNVAAPVGNGGFPDEWLECWMPISAPGDSK